MMTRPCDVENYVNSVNTGFIAFARKTNFFAKNGGTGANTAVTIANKGSYLSRCGAGQERDTGQPSHLEFTVLLSETLFRRNCTV